MSDHDYLKMLHDLLAVIHRDGGHYTEEHGLEKSVKDAHTRVLEDRGFLEEVQEAYRDECIARSETLCELAEAREEMDQIKKY